MMSGASVVRKDFDRAAGLTGGLFYDPRADLVADLTSPVGMALHPDIARDVGGQRQNSHVCRFVKKSAAKRVIDDVEHAAVRAGSTVSDRDVNHARNCIGFFRRKRIRLDR